MNATYPPRWLGNVELTVHGSTRHPHLAQPLKDAIASSDKLTGSLFIGYPIGADAVLVSAGGQTTAILLEPGQLPLQEHIRRQDRAFNAVDSLLRTNPALMVRRLSKVNLQTVTFTTQPPPESYDPTYPILHIRDAAACLASFQQNPPQDVQPQDVLQQLLLTQ